MTLFSTNDLQLRQNNLECIIPSPKSPSVGSYLMRVWIFPSHACTRTGSLNLSHILQPNISCHFTSLCDLGFFHVFNSSYYSTTYIQNFQVTKTQRIQHHNCGDLIQCVFYHVNCMYFVSLINKFLNAVIHDLSISHVDQ